MPLNRLVAAALILAAVGSLPAWAQMPATAPITSSSPATDKLPPAAAASPSGTPAAAPGSAMTAAPATAEGQAAVPDCQAPIPAYPPMGDQKLTAALTGAGPGARGAIWQPRGGEVSFTLASIDGKIVDPLNIVTCFRWHRSSREETWFASPLPLRIIKADPGSITYGARIPELPPAQPGWLSRVRGAAGEEEFAGLWIVPIADFRIVATSTAAWKSLDVVLPVGVTSVSFATLLALSSIVGAWAMLYRFAAGRGVRGSDPVLKLVSTRAGLASLSQLQTLLWSFVVGASAIYVMALSGGLLDISNGTLVLLGITGVSFVGSKLQTHIEDRARAAAPEPIPPPLDPNRHPVWSDLIIAPAGGNTVDMARVQMLFFTVIGAIFVALKVYTGNTIPDIPDGFLLLMGISNGVYLSAKVIPG